MNYLVDNHILAPSNNPVLVSERLPDSVSVGPPPANQHTVDQTVRYFHATVVIIKILATSIITMTATSSQPRSVGSFEEYLVRQLSSGCLSPLTEIENKISQNYPDTSLRQLQHILFQAQRAQRVCYEYGILPQASKTSKVSNEERPSMSVASVLIIEVVLLKMLRFTLSREQFGLFLGKISHDSVNEESLTNETMTTEKKGVIDSLWNLHRYILGSRPSYLDMMTWANIPNLTAVEKPADLLPLLPNPHLPEFQHLPPSPVLLSWISEVLFPMVSRPTRKAKIALLYSVHKIFSAPPRDDEESVVRKILAPLNITDETLAEFLRERALTPRCLLESKEKIIGTKPKIYLLQPISQGERKMHGVPLENIPPEAYLPKKSAYYEHTRLNLRVFPEMRISILAVDEEKSEPIFDEPIGLCSHTFLERISVLLFPPSKIQYGSPGADEYSLSTVTGDLPEDLLVYLVKNLSLYDKSQWVKYIMIGESNYSTVVEKIASVFKELRETMYKEYRQLQDNIWDESSELHKWHTSWLGLHREINRFLVCQRVLDQLFQAYLRTPNLETLRPILPFLRCPDSDGILIVSKRFISNLVLAIVEKGSVEEIDEMFSGFLMSDGSPVSPENKILIDGARLAAALNKRADIFHTRDDNVTMRQAVMRVFNMGGSSLSIFGVSDS